MSKRKGDGRMVRRSELVEIRNFGDRILPELGKIKIGRKGEVKQSSKGKTFKLPEKLDYFVITTNQRAPDGNFLVDKEVHKLVGEKPTRLDIFLPFDDINLNFQSFYARYTARRCHCRGNGEIALRFEEKTESWQEIACSPESCEHFQKGECKPNGILSVILAKAPRIGGVYKFRTTSYYSIQNIRASLWELSTITCGILSGIPLELVIKPQTVQPQGSDRMVTIYVVNIEWSGDVWSLLETAERTAKRRAVARTNLAQLERAARLALESAPIDEGEEAKDVVEEFYPEVVKAEIVEEQEGEPAPAPKEEEERAEEDWGEVVKEFKKVWEKRNDYPDASPRQMLEIALVSAGYSPKKVDEKAMAEIITEISKALGFNPLEEAVEEPDREKPKEELF